MTDEVQVLGGLKDVAKDSAPVQDSELEPTGGESRGAVGAVGDVVVDGGGCGALLPV